MRAGLRADIPKKFIVEYDETFWMHFARELIIMIAVGFINVWVGVGFATGVNVCWEWKDGIHNDGFNIIDLVAGFSGTVLGFLTHRIML